MDKAELIRHKIEKRRDHNLAIGNPLFAAMAEEDIELLSFIDSLQEEPVSDDLGEYINELSKQFPEVSFAKLSRIAVRVAKWQEKQDQSTIELAEDHAMLAGMYKMKEEMMAKAIDCEVHQTNVAGIKLNSVEICSDGIMLDNTLYKEGDKVKVIVIKED